MGRLTDSYNKLGTWFKTNWRNWKEYRFVRQSWHGLNGEHLRTRKEGVLAFYETYQRNKAYQEKMPKAVFQFYDYDGEIIKCATFIREREWRKGTGIFKWLSFFAPKSISRSLDIDFSSHVGKGKAERQWNSFHYEYGIELKDGELHESGFKRYCAENNMTFIGRSE